MSAAYLRMLKHTQEQAAKAVGRAARTIRRWEADQELWSAARKEAEERWFSDVIDASRAAVLKSVQAGNAEYGLKLLERLDPRLAPPTIKHRLSGKVGLVHVLAGLPESEIERLEALSDDELAEEIERLEAGGGHD